jgi:hypothetical protein
MRKRRIFTKEDHDLIQLIIKDGDSNGNAVNKIYSQVYVVRESDYAIINNLCDKNGKDYRGQAFETIFKRNRERLKRIILKKKADIVKKENAKEEADVFSWSKSNK